MCIKELGCPACLDGSPLVNTIPQIFQRPIVYKLPLSPIRRDLTLYSELCAYVAILREVDRSHGEKQDLLRWFRMYDLINTSLYFVRHSTIFIGFTDNFLDSVKYFMANERLYYLGVSVTLSTRP